MLSHERLREVLSYDSTTGVFRWNVDLNDPKSRQRYSKSGRNGFVAGTPDKDGYLKIVIDGRGYRAHRLAWFYVYGEWPADLVDHKNRKTNDNRIKNLREADASKNMANRKPKSGSRTGLKGVTASGRGGYIAQIGGRYIGKFKEPQEAHEAYLRAARERWGSFARAA